MRKTSKSAAVWGEAQKVLVGGVNSPVRAFRAVGGSPVFMKQALGPYLYDVDGNEYADFCQSWGAILLGHAHENVLTAIRHQASLGTSYGTATEAEAHLARLIQKAFPRLEKIRLTSSGTEAVMSAVRVARGYTGRSRILKFEGCYHGHADGFLVKAGSGLATFGTPDSAGVPRETAALTATLPYNNAEAVRDFFKRNHDIACAIVEPVAGNMGVVPATKDFLEALEEGTKRTGALLVFDEVITGFRVTYGGAQHLANIKPDMTCLGKIIGGGLPVGAFGASAKIMDRLSPLGDVYQAGTLSGNPLSMAAGTAVLSSVDPEFYVSLNRKASAFAEDLRGILKSRRITAAVQNIGSMFTVFFGQKKVCDFTEVSRCDRNRFARAFRSLLDSGVYFPPSAFETCFVSAAHDETALKRAREAFQKC